MSVGVGSKCTHDALRFSPRSGCYYVECSHCGVRWAAVDADDHPRHEALLEPFGTSEDRHTPFYIRPQLQAHKLQAVMSAIRIDPKLNVNIDDLVTMLYQRPQAEVVARFKSEIQDRYAGKTPSAATRLNLLAETRDFLTRLSTMYLAR